MNHVIFSFYLLLAAGALLLAWAMRNLLNKSELLSLLGCAVLALGFAAATEGFLRTMTHVRIWSTAMAVVLSSMAACLTLDIVNRSRPRRTR